MAKFLGPDGVEYCLDHLAAFELLIDIQIDTETLQVPLWVVFRNHCYSLDHVPSKDDDESLRWQLPTDTRERHARLFCPIRWKHSHALPTMIRATLAEAKCYRTTNQGLYYKFDRSPRMPAGAVTGTYLFFKFTRNRYSPAGLVLSIESVHARTTLPMNDRGKQQLTFKIALIESLRTHHLAVLQEIRAIAQKKKSP